MHRVHFRNAATIETPIAERRHLMPAKKNVSRFFFFFFLSLIRSRCTHVYFMAAFMFKHRRDGRNDRLAENESRRGMRVSD